MYSRRPAALTLPHGGRPEAGNSLLAGEAWFETKVCIRRENSCTQDMPHASIPARGARGSDGGGRMIQFYKVNS